MKYKSMSGKIRIPSTSGHCIVVGDEFKEVPEHMEPEARALGCISEETFNKIQGNADEAPKALTAAERAEKVLSSMKLMAADAEKNFNKGDSLPNKKILKSMCGFTFTAEEFNGAWMKVMEELEGE